MIAVLVFIVVLSFLVMIHELGHFIMARRAGIGVEEFGFGLPPRIWGKKVGETIYSVNWLPFGGFVRLVGEDPTDKRRDAKNSFWSKSLKERTLVVLAGVFMNLIAAIVIFYIVVLALGFKVSIPLLIDHKFRFVNQTTQVLVADVSAESAAAKAGVKVGESIINVDGKEVASIADLKQVVGQNGGKEMPIILEDPVNNQTRVVRLAPVYNEELKSAVIGVNLGELGVLNYDTPLQKLLSGFIHSLNTTEYSFKVLGKLISYSVVNRDITPVSEGVSGPVGIASITSQALDLGAITFLQFVGLLSLNLAVMNVLPIPALDGGRFFFLLVEVVTRKKVNAEVEKWAHSIGFALLIGLILLVTYNDILKLLSS